VDEIVERAFAEIKKLEGKTESHVGADAVGSPAIKKYAISVDDRNPLYLDDEYARKSPYGGIVAPYTYIFENNHDFYAEIGEDGIIEGHIERFPAPFDALLRGGNEYEFVQRVRPNDIISFTRTVESVTLREGKAAPLAFLVNKYTYTNQRGEVLAINRETFVHTSKPKK
jgi:acyl dehydratase